MPLLPFLFWIALVWGAGWLFFPLSRRIFGDVLPDGGLAVGRVLFLATWTLLAFWAGTMGLAPQISAWFWLLFAAVGLWLFARDQISIRAEISSRKRAIRFSEATFLLVFLGFFVLRGFWSDTNGTNGEKSMDSALIGSLIRADRLPPPNPYSAGARLQSYYYFGHLETALLTRATLSTTRWSYNLMCATLPALCFSVAFSLGAALTGHLRGGAFTAGATLGLGTLQPLYQWLHPERFGLNPPFHLDYFAVSRVIPYSINEFPWFSFNQADLHAHYFDFPFALTTMALGYAIFRGQKLAVVAAIPILGAQILTNTWDFPAYALLVGLAILASQSNPKTAFGARLILAIAVISGALLLASPFLLGIKSAASPPHLLPQPASPLRPWLLLWGVFAAAWIGFLATSLRDSAPKKAEVAEVEVVRKKSKSKKVAPVEPTASPSFFDAITRFSPLFALVLVALVLGAALSSDWETPSRVVLPLIAVLLLLSGLGALRLRGENRFLCFLAMGGLVALMWSETTWAGFLGDINNPGFDDYKRQDTAFKFGLQTWMLWGMAASCGAYRVWNGLSEWFKIAVGAPFSAAFGVMLIASLSVVAGRSRVPEAIGDARLAHVDFGRGPVVWQWDGWDAWAHLTPPQQQAANWLLKHTLRGQNLLEAEQKDGGDYSRYTRYTNATGIPTVIGPQAHSFQWSPANLGDGGSEWGEVYGRKNDARAIYTLKDSAARQVLLNKYRVRYIVLGDLEMTEYGALALEDLRRDLPVVAQFGDFDDPNRVQILENRGF